MAAGGAPRRIDRGDRAPWSRPPGDRAGDHGMRVVWFFFAKKNFFLKKEAETSVSLA
jgi:hypothetical protein